VILLSGNLGGAVIVGLMGLLKTAQGNFSGSILMVVILAVGAAALALTLPEPLRHRPRPGPDDQPHRP
jgi:hypothetical protein